MDDEVEKERGMRRTQEWECRFLWNRLVSFTGRRALMMTALAIKNQQRSSLGGKSS